MIRPLTIATCLLACGSGLYLYQSKHEVQLLDRTIERTVHDTGALRDQSRLLAAEWTMLNDPERLRQFSDTYLSLKAIAPPQFTSLADLDSRLPAPLPEAPPHGTDEQGPPSVVAETAPLGEPDSATTADTAVAADEVLPVPPIPAAPSTPAVASAVRPAETRTVDRVSPPRPAVADSQAHSVTVADARPYDQRAYDQRVYEQRPSEPRQSEQRVPPRIADARADVRTPVTPPPRPIVLAAPRPMPAYAPVNTPPMQYRPPTVAAPAPYGGSLLGMARGSPPAPRPTPVNAAYSSN
jgi:hypothetical protein